MTYRQECQPLYKYWRTANRRVLTYLASRCEGCAKVQAIHRARMRRIHAAYHQGRK